MNIGQAEAAALVEVGQTFVINAQQTQHRGVELSLGSLNKGR